jgi:hypothetical protein
VIAGAPHLSVAQPVEYPKGQRDPVSSANGVGAGTGSLVS